MRFLLHLTALLGLLGLAQLTSCAHGPELTSVLSEPVDTTVQHQVQRAQARALRPGRVTFKGPVTFQFGGTGNVATATNAARAKAPVAAAPHAAASETKLAGVPWSVYLVAG